MDEQQLGLQVTFSALPRAEANQAIQDLREAILDRIGDVVARIDKDDADSQDAGSTLVLLFGSGAAVALAQGIRAYLARRGDDRDVIVIRTADGNEVIASGEAARKLDAAAVMRAAVQNAKP